MPGSQTTNQPIDASVAPLMPQRYRLSITQSIIQLVIGTFSLAVSLWIFNSHIDRPLSVLVTVLIIAVLQYALQPLLSWFAGRLGVLSVILVSFFSSSLIVWLAIGISPGISLNSWWQGLLIGWVYALIVSVMQWIFVAQRDDMFLSEILRKSPRPKASSRSDVPGFVFVQLDGLPAPVLDWQLKAGNLPNIRRLIKEENYTFRTWKTQLPSTTPASQAGILFGSNNDIPAFRWYEKDTKQMIVANQLAGAAEIERRHSNGKGLLADGGVSIGNLFSGDAAENVMVMSRLSGEHESIKRMSEYTAYFASPFGFMRSMILSIGEMVKEVYQARHQVARDMRPRIKRHGSYIVLRAATNVLLRNLQTSVVISTMMRGKNAIYVDYVDYDEIAHHTGMARAEAFDSLSGLDRIVGMLDKARRYAPRPYEIVLLSDHGQSQGPTFKQLHDGKTLQDFVAEYADARGVVDAQTDPVEEQGASRSLLAETSKSKGLRGAIASRIFKKYDDKPDKPVPQDNKIVVTASGNLGNVWLDTINGRATKEQIDADYPHLIDSLLNTNGIGLLMVKSQSEGFMCITKSGTRNLETGTVTGSDPLAPYDGRFAAELLRVTSMRNAPDIALISAYDQESGEVYAFEELVGNHGGIGGWQTEAVLLFPGKLKIPTHYLDDDGHIHGAEHVHHVLKSWLPKN